MYGNLWIRAAQYALVFWAALTINFALPRIAPGDPIDYMFGDDIGSFSEEQRQQILSEYGLDRPIPAQYADYLLGLARGDLGSSVRLGRPVTEILSERMPWTLLLTGGATVISVIAGVLIGMTSGWRRGKKSDIGLLAFLMSIDSMPPFWVAMILISIFSLTLGLFPAFGAVPIGTDAGLSYVLEVARRLVLPMSTLTVAYVGNVYLISRYSMVSTLGEDYIAMAEAKGVGEWGIMFRHALRNALLPVFTNVTLSLGTLLGGSIVVETVFSYPGLGLLINESVTSRDYNLLQGAFLLIAVGVIAANLIADLTYPLIDPRVRSASA